ncbi:MAG TPA: hypothetical protein VHE60_18890 [Pyrinomonadaceae bacterium]|nr:hypothetical protein [Pyrinomonadaceae bacterium]
MAKPSIECLTHPLTRVVLTSCSRDKEGDGAFAVVDIDTLWIDRDGKENHWKGRTCKVYTKIGNEWKLIMQTGVLDYS